MTGSTSLDNKKSAAPSHATSPRAAAKKHWFIVMSQYLGSIKLALGAGTIFTIAMIIGTCLESWYSAAIAQELIYYSWWFLGLLTLLAICIFFAAMKKWPWKKHQTGFLITHMGLLTMLAGGVLNFIGGVDGTMQLVDNKTIAEQQNGIENRSNQVFLTQNQVVTVLRTVTGADGQRERKEFEYRVNNGPLPWGTLLGKDIPIPWAIRALSLFANPLPRSIDVKPFPDLRLEVIGFLPHARIERVEEARDKEYGFPAIKIEVNLKETGSGKPRWISLMQDRDSGLPALFGDPKMGYMVEFIGKCHSSLVDEFGKPPSQADRGPKGQLVFNIAGKKYRVSVADNLGKTIPLGDSGWKFLLEKYAPNTSDDPKNDQPEVPFVVGKFISPQGKETKYHIASRLVMSFGPLNSLEEPVEELPEGLPAVWYHPPDLRYTYSGKLNDRPHIKTLLQFVQSSDNKLYYRSLVEQGDELVSDSAGLAPATGVARNIWEKHAGSFLIEEHLPHAKPCLQRVTPVAKRPGLITDSTPPAVLVRLTLSKRATGGEMKTYSVDRWIELGRSSRISIAGTHEGESFNEQVSVSFNYKRMQLPFDIELTRAESQLDPGTNSPATFSSFVKLYDSDQNIDGEDRHITMNEPLNHRGYKVYQSQFDRQGIDPESFRPIAVSGFTVGRDPGLWLKYLGTAMLGIGIATMYYMKAYDPRNLFKTIATLTTQ